MSRYSDMLKSIINSCRSRIEEIDADIEMIKANRSYSQEYINTRVSAYNAQKENAYNNHNKLLSEAHSDYLERLQKSIESISGNNVNTADLALLDNKYIKISQKEFDVLANRHKGNSVMLNALSNYAAENGLSMPVPYLNYEQKKKLAYDYCCQCAGYLTCSGLQWALIESSNYFNEISEQLSE